MSGAVRVRFAPSPTGHLHIGGARTAIYNWAFARHHEGTFVLRIDDTDPERSTQENVGVILRSMRWLGLDWDEGPEVGGERGPYFQTQRADTYVEALDSLKASGAAYPCFCSAQVLDAKRETMRAAGGNAGYDRTCHALASDDAAARVAAGEPHVWRLAVPEGRGDVVVDDIIRGEVRFPADALDDLVLVRTDGTPTYNFATVVDDCRMGITHVIRGDDHLSNTPRQILIYDALAADVPHFAHMSLIFGPDGKKISKRHGGTSVESYRDEGFLPQALLNYLALLGWSLDEKDVFSRDELVAGFDLARVSRNPAIWDREKLEWMNGVYLRGLSADAFVDEMVPWLERSGLMSADEAASRRDWLLALTPIVSERLTTLDELPPLVGFLFGDTVDIDPAAKTKVLDAEGSSQCLLAARDALESVEPFEHETIEQVLRAVPESLGVKPKAVFQAVRVAVTGSTVSPPLFESLELLGRPRTLLRLDHALG